MWFVLCAVIAIAIRMEMLAWRVHTAMVINICTERIDHAYMDALIYRAKVQEHQLHLAVLNIVNSIWLSIGRSLCKEYTVLKCTTYILAYFLHNVHYYDATVTLVCPLQSSMHYKSSITET